MYRMIKASSNKKYQCYYNETILVEQPDGSSREYIGKKVLTDSFDTEAEAEKYCRTHVGSQKVGDGYIENDMNYEEVEASADISSNISTSGLLNILPDSIANYAQYEPGLDDIWVDLDYFTVQDILKRQAGFAIEEESGSHTSRETYLRRGDIDIILTGYISRDDCYIKLDRVDTVQASSAVKASDIAGSEYMIVLVDDKNDKPLGYVTGYRRGGYYHPGDIIQCVYDEDQCDLIFDDLAKAKRRLAMYNHYSEVYMYDKTSRDYPMPSEKFKKKEVPTHLEVVEVETDV